MKDGTLFIDLAYQQMFNRFAAALSSLFGSEEEASVSGDHFEMDVDSPHVCSVCSPADGERFDFALRCS